MIGTCSLDCPDACSWVVGVRDGVAVQLRGNPEHPFTRGGLCAKVNPYLEYAARPDRLLHPLRRVGAKGEGRFVRISWDEALAEISGRLREVIDTWGAEAIWPYAGTGSVGTLQGLGATAKRLFHALGASRHDANICARAGHLGLLYTMGTATSMDPEDLEHAGLIVLWGTNTLTTNLHLWPVITKARARGARLVVVDPVRTRTAAQADRHLAPRPGTDAALALGVMARLVELGAADEEFLHRQALGWPEFRDQVLSGWSAARAAEVCGLEIAEVEWLAQQFATRRPAAIRTLMGMQRHAGGGQAMRALSCLPAVTGDLVRPGGGFCYSTGTAYALDEDALCRPDLQPNGPTRQLAMTRLGEGLLEVTDPPVMALLMWAANPVVSNPEQARVRAGLGREDLFVVAVDHVRTASTDYADIVLPGTTQLEHHELQDSYTHLYLHWNAPAVAAPGECLPHNEIFRRLAAAMGYTDPVFQACDQELARAALGSGAPALAGITLERLQERGWLRLSVPRPYLPFAEGFPTPSGRFEFLSQQAEADGLGRFPGYTPPFEAARPPAPASTPAPVPAQADDSGVGEPGAVQVALISAANHYLINSTFSTSAAHARAGGPVVLVHPDDATRAGVRDGRPVRLVNDRGEFTAIARISAAVRPGVAATTKGLAPVDGGTTVNATVAERDADLGRGGIFHDNLVQLVPVRETVPVPASAAVGRLPGTAAADHGIR